MDTRAADAYHALLSPELRLAHQALLAWAAEMEPDGWPTPATVLRFATCYGVPAAPLGALFGLLSYRLGNRTVWCDEVRDHGAACRAGVTRFGNAVMVPYGIFRMADDTMAQEAATMMH